MINDLSARRREAERKWQSLQTSTIPVIHVGTATCGRAAGALDVLESVQETLKEHRLKATVVSVGCIGPCYLEPLMDITMPGASRISYANVTQDTARKIIERLLIKGNPSPELAVAHFGDNGSGNGNGMMHGVPKFFELPMLKNQVRLVLKNCGFIDPEEIDHYLANDGYVGLATALEKSPEDVITEVKEAGLRGRRGSGIPDPSEMGDLPECAGVREIYDLQLL